MATKFFSDGAVHAYFNPYETPYDAFMNYMNVLSDFEIRLNKLFPDTAEQDQIFKLGTQLIEKDMLIEKQATEIEKLAKKIAKITPAVKSVKKRPVKSSEKKPAKVSIPKKIKVTEEKQTKASEKRVLVSKAKGKSIPGLKIVKKTTSAKSGKKAAIKKNKK
jgi:alpha-amylase